MTMLDPNYEEREALMKAVGALKLELAYEKLPWCKNYNYMQRGWWAFFRKKHLDKIDRTIKILQAVDNYLNAELKEAKEDRRPEGSLKCVIEHEDVDCLPVNEMREKGYYLLEQKLENGKYKATFTNWR